MALETRDGRPLTESEARVLAGLVREQTAAQIAAELNLSLGTVKAQLSSIYRRLGVRGRQGAVLHAVQRGWATAAGEWRGIP